VRVMSVDVPRKRIALSMKTQGTAKPAGAPSGGSAGKPAQGKDASRDRKPAPPKAPEPPKPGVAPNGMRIVTKR